MRLTREEFIQAIKVIETMINEENSIMNALDINPEWTPGTWVNEYYELVSQMCDFRENDYTIDYGSDLDYFCWELNFGKNWKPKKWKLGMVADDGEDINFGDAGAVYDYIVRTQNNK